MLDRVISGGQTGVDRGALDAAIEVGLDHGGWCPAGRRAEDGTIPARYRLDETEERAYRVRTVANVRDSDATLVLSPLPLSGGTQLTAQAALRLGRPLLTVDPADDLAAERITVWLNETRPGTLNVAGPRESGRPGIARRVRALLRTVFQGAAGS